MPSPSENMIKGSGTEPQRRTLLEDVKSYFRGDEQRLIEEAEYMRGRFLLQLLTKQEKL